MQIIMDGPSGPKVVEVDFADLGEKELRVYAQIGIVEAREELKKRIGFDPYKAIEDYTPDDLKFFMNWEKNKDSQDQDKIVVESSDEGSNE
jgi:hypothetical protein